MIEIVPRSLLFVSVGMGQCPRGGSIIIGQLLRQQRRAIFP